MLEEVVRHRDLSFRACDPAAVEAALSAARAAVSDGAERFLLAAMRAMALPDNAHTRLIPQPAIRTLPLRFVASGADVWLTEAEGVDLPLPARLLSVDGGRPEAVLRRAAPLLPGPPQRKAVVGALLFAWPAALRALDMPDRPVLLLEGPDGDALRLDTAPLPLVPAGRVYPLNEHSRPQAAARSATGAHRHAGLWHLALRDFSVPDLPERLSALLDGIAEAPDLPLILDLRGNTGGDFLNTLAFLDRLEREWRGPAAALLIDRCTFSAAIVCACLVPHRLSRTVHLVGEPPGDRMTFWAEGGRLPLPGSGAILRHCDGWHDWQTGRATEDTPRNIAERMIAAPLPAPLEAVQDPRDHAAGRDPVRARAAQALGA